MKNVELVFVWKIQVNFFLWKYILDFYEKYIFGFCMKNIGQIFMKNIDKILWKIHIKFL